ncbi:MAG: hypothetical protein CMF61_07600 [Magnetococcales bacterium]|nr:hypothetical protein [Magnetococcales bacterium]|tara:strand:- start:54 stop:836 length:783 start_codon:yes stop_codon:yes gene_type:complete
MLTHLSDRALLGLKGNDTESFLQSVITNDIQRLKNEACIYTAHLTTKGKFLFDFFISKKDDMFLIDCNKNELMPLAQSLHKYVVSKNVEFHDLSEDYKLISSDVALDKNESDIQYQDPRLEALGFRCWVKELPESINPLENYTLKRLNLGIIDGAYDAIKEKTLINELNFESLNGVSFNKGCYVGQELTARTKFRTEPKKKIFKVKLSGETEIGSVILCGKMDAGWMFTNKDGVGLALIRTRYINKDLTLGGQPIEILTA